MKQEQQLTRRDILKMGLGGFLAVSTPALIMNTAEASRYGTWRVAFRNAHTDESFSGVYRVGNKYLPEAFERINYILRDFRTGEVFPMDPKILDIMASLHKKTNSHEPFEVLSGYRSPKTNSMLRNVSTGVARNSYHLFGQAIDLRLPGYSTRRLRDRAKSLRVGGVGYYSKSNFIHMDTGEIRYW